MDARCVISSCRLPLENEKVPDQAREESSVAASTSCSSSRLVRYSTSVCRRWAWKSTVLGMVQVIALILAMALLVGGGHEGMEAARWKVGLQARQKCRKHCFTPPFPVRENLFGFGHPWASKPDKTSCTSEKPTNRFEQAMQPPGVTTMSASGSDEPISTVLEA